MGLNENTDARMIETGSLVAAKWHSPDYTFGFVSDEEPDSIFSNKVLAVADHVVLLLGPERANAMLTEAECDFFCTFSEYFPGVITELFPPDSKYQLEVAIREALLVWLQNYPV